MKVQLVAKVIGVGKYENLSSEEVISAIARHGIIKEDNGKLVKYLMTNKHWSPLDMVNFVFEVETSRAIGRQMLRHSSIKVQEHSQRYSDRVEIEPFELRKEHPTNRQSSVEIYNPYIIYDNNCSTYSGYATVMVEAALLTIFNTYKALIKAGVAKECARMILPECTKTTMTFNGTLRSWLSFLNVRMEEHSQKEIQLIAEEIGNILSQELPEVFKQIDWKNGLFM